MKFRGPNIDYDGQLHPDGEFDLGNSGAGTVTVDFAKGNRQKITMTGDCTFGVPSNLKAGATYVLRLIGDGTALRTPTWNAVFKWPNDTAPVLGGPNAIDLIAFYTDGVNLYGSIASGRYGSRITEVASSATPTPNSDTTDLYVVTALAVGATFEAPTGTPVQGQRLVVRIKDDGTSRTLSFNAIYRASTDLALPTATTLGKTLYLGFMFNATDTKWDLLAKLDNI